MKRCCVGCVGAIALLMLSSAIWFHLARNREEVNKRLLDAAAAGDYGAVQRALDAGADPNYKPNYESTGMSLTDIFVQLTEPRILYGVPIYSGPLDAASRGDNVKTIRLLAKAGANLNARETTCRTTPLMDAIDADHPVIAAELISHGADTRAADSIGITFRIGRVSFFACRSGFVRGLLGAAPLANPNQLTVHRDYRKRGGLPRSSAQTNQTGVPSGNRATSPWRGMILWYGRPLAPIPPPTQNPGGCY